MKTWNDITLEQFKLIEKEKDDLKVLAILEDRPVSEIESLNLQEFQSTIDKWQFIKETPDIVPVDIIKIKGNYYSMIDLSKITVGEFETCQQFLQSGNIEGFISVLYREVELTFIQRVKLFLRLKKKVLTKFKLKPYNEDDRIELMNEVKYLPYSFIYSASVFFSLLGASSLETFNNYLNKKVKELETDLMKNGEQLPY